MSLTNEQISDIWNAMPDGFDGFCKTWGFQQFARAVIEAAEIKQAEVFDEVLQALIRMTDATERWNAAVEVIIGRPANTQIDVEEAREIIAKAMK